MRETMAGGRRRGTEPPENEHSGGRKRHAKEEEETVVVLDDDDECRMEAEVAKLRGRWELASVLNFLNVRSHLSVIESLFLHFL